MQGRDDVAGFIAGFAGDDRYIVDYLAEEVLARQPDHVRQFLLQTSVLERLSGPLCDAVTGRDGGHAVLAALDRGNLFLVPLDHRRRWYRYHHLFADVLRAHLRDEQPGAVAGLHRRAGGWFERHGEPAEAIRHALAGADVDRAADLVELAIPATQQARQEATLRAWLEALPDEVVRVRPVLSNGYAGSLLVRGEVAGVEARLRIGVAAVRRDEVRARPVREPQQSGSRSSPRVVVVLDEVERPPCVGRRRGDVPEDQGQSGAVDGDRSREAAERVLVRHHHLAPGERGSRSGTRRRAQPVLGVPQASLDARDFAPDQQ